MAGENVMYSLADLSEQFQLELRGEGDVLIDGVGTLYGGGKGKISFLANPSYRKELPGTAVSAVILKADDAEQCPTHCLVAEDPYLAFARIAALFDPRPGGKPGVHSSAVVAGTAEIGKNVSIGPHVVVGENCRIGDACTIGPGTVLDENCSLGAGCRLHANVSLGYGVTLGQRVTVHPGAVIGADGFGIAFAGDRWEKVPQLGSVEIGDDCEIGANTCIDRGAIDNTVLEEDVRLDNLCQIAHNVRIGAHTAMAGRAGIAGSTHIGRYCLIGGAAGVSGHLQIADRTTIAAASVAFRSITEPGTTWSGQITARPISEWQKTAARLPRLDKLARAVQQLERELGKSKQDD